MQTNAIPTSAPGDRAPSSEEPAPIEMTNQQHYKLNQAIPVRTVATAHSPIQPHARRTARRPHSIVASARPHAASFAKSESCLCTLHLLQA